MRPEPAQQQLHLRTLSNSHKAASFSLPTTSHSLSTSPSLELSLSLSHSLCLLWVNLRAHKLCWLSLLPLRVSSLINFCILMIFEPRCDRQPASAPKPNQAHTQHRALYRTPWLRWPWSRPKSSYVSYMRSPHKCQIRFSIKWDKYGNFYGIL